MGRNQKNESINVKQDDGIIPIFQEPVRCTKSDLMTQTQLKMYELMSRHRIFISKTINDVIMRSFFQ